ncbi:hypothetical protein GCM10007907_20490 [Chitinimonas prasina]|uniref:Uncharacterized protein n=1 Tax=Chitinimonas prasina TaxID=1434937 RepID=A0ABQ5YJY2_9NEIS|nr:hypothetical protein [Chitinimonas prasina]GLR13259.1 hypothetical protein GCM10007907_20490 [Chitinimonas prasina]
MSLKNKVKQVVLSTVMATFCMPFQYAHATETIVVIGKRPGGPSVDDLRDAVDREEALRYGEWLESQMQPIDVVAVEITSLDTRCHPDGTQAVSTDGSFERYQAAHDTFTSTLHALRSSASNLNGKEITIIFADGGREKYKVNAFSTGLLTPVKDSIVVGSGKAEPGCGKKG